MIWSANNFLARFKIIPLLLLTLPGCTDLSLFVVNRLAALSDYSSYVDIPYGPDSLHKRGRNYLKDIEYINCIIF